MRKLMLLVAFLGFLGMQAFAQKTITGTVTSAADGSALPGVSVIVKGTNIGTITDVNGKYTLEVPADAKTLVFSFVGYKTVEVPITSDVINVQMQEEAVGLEEVVVTALGISREKKALDYAVQELGGDDVSQVKTTNVLTSLSGKIAGVQITQSSGAVGSSANIVIRGYRSFGNNMPLFVVDGTPISNATSGGSQWGGVDFGNALMDLNPDDIASISVLKGANATALYGSRGANGVILITTKKAAKKKGIGLRINTGVTFDNVYILPYYQDKYGQGYFGSEYYYKEGMTKWLIANYGTDFGYSNIPDMMDYQTYATGGVFGITGFSYYDGNWNGVMDGMDESWGPRLDIGLQIPQFDSPVLYDANGNFIGYEPTPWVSQPNNVKDFFVTGLTFDNNVEITGGDEKAGVRLSIGNQTVKGAIPNTDLTKNSVFLNGRIQLTNKLKAEANVNYINNHSNNLPGGGYDENNVMQSIGSWFGRQVNMTSLRDHWNELDPLGYPYNWNHSYHNNPYYTVYVNTTSRTRNRVFGNLQLTYDIAKWLNFMVRVGNDYYTEVRKHVWGSLSQEAAIANGPDASTGGGFWQSVRTFDELNVDAFFNMNFDIIPNTLSFDGLLGANYRSDVFHFMSYTANELTVPDFFTISNVKGNPATSQYDSRLKQNSVFFSGNISYKNWLYLSGSIRNDWSSTLPPENWSYMYYSLGGSIIITDALAIKSDLLSFAKLRVSYAQVGNDTGPYQLSGVYVADQPFSGVTAFSYTNSLPPLNLKPEITASSELGLEMRFLNNRLGFDLTLYDMKSRNQILAVDIAPSTGFTSMRINAGEIENKGIELVANVVPVKLKNFSWSVDFNWARNINTVNELYGDLESYQLNSSWKGTVVEARPGQVYGVLRGPGIMRDPQGRILINPETGLPQTSPDLIEFGTVIPDWTGGIRNTFDFGWLSFSFLVDMRKGGKLFSITDWFGAYAGILSYTAEGDIRENGLVVGQDVLADQEAVYGTLAADGSVIYMDADGNVVADPVANTTVTGAQDYFEGYWFMGAEPSIIDGTYIKLREAALTINFPKSFVSKLGFVKDLKFSFIGRNLALLYTDKSNRAHIDPEVSYGTSIGFEQYQIPPTRSLGFKLSIGF